MPNNARQILRYEQLLLARYAHLEPFAEPEARSFTLRTTGGLYVCRKPVKADRDSLFASWNEGIMLYMLGPNDLFATTGTLKDYDATPFLSKIKVPTLFTVGEFDDAGTDNVKSFASKVPNSRYVEFRGAAHITMWDARDENVKVVREFLDSVDSSNKR